MHFIPVTVIVIQSLTITSTTAREALKTVDLNPTGTRGPPCRLHLQKDLPRDDEAAQPIYLVPNTTDYWLPRESGYIEVSRGMSIELYCQTGYLILPLKRSMTGTKTVIAHNGSLHAVCLHDRTFRLQGEQYEFRQFACSQQTKYTVQCTNVSCAEATATLYRIGYSVTPQRFIETMTICYDDRNLRTLYAQHRLGTTNVHFQRHVKRPYFSKAGFFKGHNMNYLYTQENQWQRVAELLGTNGDNLSGYLNNVTMFLTRGHLVAKSDLIYASQQRSSFTFFNVAPQWQSFNSGQWARLEEEVRQFVARAQIDIDSYSGTWGILQLPKELFAKSGDKASFRDLYLGSDGNNNGLLPVPLIFYRLLIDSHNTGRGIVLIGLNNPHTSLNQIEKEHLICDDVRGKVSWLNWIQNTNLRKGYLYACAVRDFMGVVKGLPRKLMEVKELLTLD